MQERQAGGRRIVDDDHHQGDEEVQRQAQAGRLEPSPEGVAPQQAGGNGLKDAFGSDPSQPRGRDGIQPVEDSDGQRPEQDRAPG